jgi:hypothetical protein
VSLATRGFTGVWRLPSKEDAPRERDASGVFLNRAKFLRMDASAVHEREVHDEVMDLPLTGRERRSLTFH